ncbi:MAG: nuclear transport factor 2 family protein [Proteobacteria bacterium]|nr:nuclear transport factor 2 family protein [Pseudomonadota bacterium]
MTPSDAQLQEMLDEFELRKLVHSYCRAVDRGDFARLRSLYHEDAEDDHGAFSAGSAESFIGKLAAARTHIQSMQHHVTTANFAVRGNMAEGEIYTIAIQTFGAGDHDVDVIVGGRYLDKYEKRSQNWKFVHRKIVTDWAHVNDPSTADLSHPMTKDTPRGRSDMNDPSFQFFSLLTNGVR